MGSFPTRLILAPLDDGVNWILWMSFYYKDDDLGMIAVPQGMITDGGSIPKIFQNVIAPMGKGLKAFVVHDALYKYQWFSREDSDRCLWRMLKELKEPSLEADVIYDAVRLGGAEHWKPKETPNGPTAGIINSTSPTSTPTATDPNK